MVYRGSAGNYCWFNAPSTENPIEYCAWRESLVSQQRELRWRISLRALSSFLCSFFGELYSPYAILMSVKWYATSIPLQHPASLENISIKSFFVFNNFIAKYYNVAEILRVLLALVLRWTNCNVGRNFHSFWATFDINKKKIESFYE